MNWTGVPSESEPIAFRALPSLSVRRYRTRGVLATSWIDFRHLPFGGGGAVWSPGERWQQLPQPEPPRLYDAIRAFFMRHSRRPRPLHPKYRSAVC